jgi:tetratricopeptide (TPR) repeat protein
MLTAAGESVAFFDPTSRDAALGNGHPTSITFMGERDDLLDAVKARLREVRAFRDFAPVLEPDALIEARQLAEGLTGDDHDRTALRLLGWLYWYRYRALSPGQVNNDLQTAIAMFTPCFIAGDEDLPEPLLPHLADVAAPHALDLLSDDDESRGAARVQATAALWQRISDSSTDHPDRPIILGYLTMALDRRYQHTQASSDLDDLIEASQAAARAIPPDYPPEIRGAHLNDLGQALCTRFERAGAFDDLQTAIATLQEALATNPAKGIIQAATCYQLGWALRIRFERTGSPADSDAAVEAGRTAVNLAPADHYLRVKALAALSLAYQARFRRTGSPADLDAAVDAGRRGLRALPVGHVDQSAMLAALAIPLLARFNRTGALADADAAVEAFREAVDVNPAQLTNLGSALRDRFERTRSSADLDAAVRAGESALRTSSADTDLARPMVELAATLLARFRHTADPADLGAAIDALTDAGRAIPADHLDRARVLNNLGTALLTRFELTEVSADLDDAIRSLTAAVDATPADHPDLAGHLTNLGIALRARFDRTTLLSDRVAAVSAFAHAVDVAAAAPVERIIAARLVSSLAVSAAPERMADLLETAVRLLPEVAPRRLVRSDQQHAIGQVRELAVDAAAFALATTASTTGERAARALRLLETGRSVLLSQALETRSDLTDLRQQHPELATRFEDLRDQLDQDTSATGAHDGRHLLVDELTATLARIRACNGFGSFGLPPTVDELVAEAAAGPVVTFNISQYRSDAVLLTANGITSVELRRLTRDAVIDRVNAFHQALDVTTNPAASPAARVDAQATLRTILEWLWDQATEPVLHSLGYRGQPSSREEWPRVWWVTGGLLGLLPVHAAGHHTDPPEARRAVMDRVISSYTPTIRALRHARQRDRATRADAALVVAMPTTPGVPGRLHHVPAEATLLHNRLPHAVLLTEPDTTDPAVASALQPTKATVLARLARYPIAHFACHGVSDTADPSKSRLLLHDHATDPLPSGSKVSRLIWVMR